MDNDLIAKPPYETNTRSVYFDVDNTLVMWPGGSTGFKGAVDGKDLIDIAGYKVSPHLKHIQLLKDYKVSGCDIIVWSQAGKAWANAVVDALGIREFVDYCLTKPDVYVDDLEAGHFMTTRQYLDPK